MQDFNGLNLCYRGGLLGIYSQIEKRPFGNVTEPHSDDISCLISEHFDGLEAPKIKVGAKAELKEALLVEFSKHQNSLQKSIGLTACLAIETKTSGILLDTEANRVNQIGGVVRITMVMLYKDPQGKTLAISQYPIPLRFDHELPSLQDFSRRRHYQWDFCQASEWTKVKKNGVWVNQIAYAFCEFTEEQQILETRIIKFESEGQNHQNPKFYVLGIKLVCFAKPLNDKDVNIRKDEHGNVIGAILALVPRFD